MWANARAPPPARVRPSERPARRSASGRSPVARSPSTTRQLPRVGRGHPRGAVRGARAGAEEHHVGTSSGSWRQGRGGDRSAGAGDQDHGIGLPEAELPPGQVGAGGRVVRHQDHAVVVALGPVQALRVDHPRNGDGDVLGEPAAQQVRDLLDAGARMHGDDGHHRRLRGAAARCRTAGRPQPLRDLREQGAGGHGVVGQHLLERGARDLEHRRVAPGADAGGPRLAGQERQLADHLTRTELAHDRSGDVDLQPAAAHDVRRAGRIAGPDQPVPGGHLHQPRGGLQPAARVLRHPGQHRHPGEVGRRLPPTRSR